MSGLIRPVKNIVRKVSTDVLRKPKMYSYKDSIMNLSENKLTALDSGLKIATQVNGKELATVGVWISTGSRYEKPQYNGVGNILDHVAYRSTKKRSQLQLELEAGKLGIELNSYVTRDHTAIYANCLKEYVPQAVELISDILQNPKLEEEDIDKTREIILEEMKELVLHDIVFDYLHDTAFQCQSLGQAIYGSSNNIKSIIKEDIEDYHTTNFKPGRMVLAGAGGINHEQLVELGSKHFNDLPGSMEGATPDMGINNFIGGEMIERNDDLPFAHIAMAIPIPGRDNNQLLALQLASIIVGSWDKTHGAGPQSASKLASVVSTKNYAHAFQSFVINYEEQGLWGIYFVCERLQLWDFVYSLGEEWTRIAIQISDFEVLRAKNTLRSKMLLQCAGMTANCENMAKQVLQHDRRIPFAEIDAKLDSIDASQVKAACMKYIYDMDFAIAGIGPIEQLPDYNVIRGRLYRFTV